MPPLEAALAALCLVAFSCVCPPSANEVLEAGFRSPEQTFRTFQIALRGDLVDLEYRCWSLGFKRRNDLSQLVYREFRDQLLDESPWIRWFGEAEIRTSERLAPDRHRLVAAVFGRTFEVELEREEFAELWSEEELIADEEIRFDERVDVSEDPARGERWLGTRARLPAGVDPDQVAEWRVGREWKISDLREVEEEPGPEAENETPPRSRVAAGSRTETPRS